MSKWQKKGEEANIVIVGNMNPKIFHPEWFIRKGIVSEWDYREGELLSVPDMTQFDLPDGLILSVTLDKFTIRASQSSSYQQLDEFVTNTFHHLKETPVKQLGFNYSRIISVASEKDWKRFGENLTPKSSWNAALSHIDELTEEKQKVFGLLHYANAKT